MKTGIYFLISKGKVVYIGATTVYPNRIKQHKDKVFDTHRFIPCSDKLLASYEKRLIGIFNPKYNKSNGACKTRKAYVKPSEKVILVGFYTKKGIIDGLGGMAKVREFAKYHIEHLSLSEPS